MQAAGCEAFCAFGTCFAGDPRMSTTEGKQMSKHRQLLINQSNPSIEKRARDRGSWEPVPWTRRSKNGRLFRRPRTTNERRAHFSNKATKEILEFHAVVFKLRQERNSERLPNAHDDLSLRYQRSWKEHRGAQRKTGGCINRRIHSPPFWDW